MRWGLTTFAVSTLLASTALASTLQLVPGKAKPAFTWDVPDAAVFQRYNDLWLVTSTPDRVNVNIPDEEAKKLGIIGQEVLQVRGGQGVRLSFAKLPGVDALQKDGQFEFDITARPAPVQQMLTFKRGPADVQWTSPKAGKMVRAFSPATKEMYPVLTTTTPAGVRKGEVHADIQFLPTTLGAVLVNRRGQTMNITGDATQGFNLAHLVPDVKAKTASTGTYGEELSSLLAMFPLDKTAHSTFVNAITQAQNAVVEAQRVATQLLAPQTPVYDAPAPVKPLGNMPVKTEEIAALEAPKPATPPATLTEATSELLPTPPVAVSAVSGENLAEVAQRYAPRIFTAAQRDAVTAFVVAKTDEERHQAILDWAEMMFSFERYAEVIGLLQTLPQDDATHLPMLTEARLMEVAASMMLGRVTDAEKILASITENSPQLQLWQAATMVERGKYADALPKFKEYAEGMATYPKPVRRQLEVWALTAAYEAEQYTALLPQAKAILERDGEFTLPMVSLLAAKAQIKLSQKEDARSILVELQKNPDPYVRVQADITNTSLLLDSGDITIDEAFAEYEKARFAWRGDKVERDLTFNLANLYLKNSRYLEALELFKYYTVVFPNAEHTDEAAKLMTDVFNQLFTTDLAEQVLDPLTQLALYFEFRELTPPGPEGTAMMKRVIRKLADTSLYPRAIELLERLISFRLQTPAEKAEAGLTLAELHYANRSFPEGLKALAMTAGPGPLTPLLLEQRQLLQGKLQLALGKPDEALQAIASVKSKQADYLRATIAWTNNNYAEVSRLLTPYFQSRDVAANWQTEDHVALMQLALAYALQREPNDLARLYTNFTQEIALLKLDGAFQFLRDLAGDSGDALQNQDLWQNLLKALGTVRNFEDFYDKFRAMRFTRKPAETASTAQ